MTQSSNVSLLRQTSNPKLDPAAFQETGRIGKMIVDECRQDLSKSLRVKLAEQQCVTICCGCLSVTLLLACWLVLIPLQQQFENGPVMISDPDHFAELVQLDAFAEPNSMYVVLAVPGFKLRTLKNHVASHGYGLGEGLSWSSLTPSEPAWVYPSRFAAYSTSWSTGSDQQHGLLVRFPKKLKQSYIYDSVLTTTYSNYFFP